MTDLHTHALFGIDDGSSSIEMSTAILDTMKKQGCSRIAFTPHFSFDKSISEYKESVNEAVAKLEPYLLANNFEWIVGSEVNLSLSIVPQEISALTLGDTRYILIELPYSSDISESIFNKIRDMIDYNNLIPIIAHIERYPYLLSHPKVAYDLKEQGCVLQLNSGSLLNKRTARFANALIKNNLIDIICSDVHNTTTRVFNLEKTGKIVSEKYGKDIWERFAANADKIFEGKGLNNVVYNKVSKFFKFYF